ncbi:MAG TPA: type IVB secretion system protein IcmW [Gammaproteobacteria bacterium]|jgi:intracellular multiplication protein IcmW|nr:type IVB secretion system protein IcmW [Gammaproteobacteria bacterium]
MSILDLASAHEFWKNYDDPMIYRVIAFMETAEKWTLDGNPELEKALTKLGNELESLSSFDLGKEEEFVAVCAHIRTSRILRILQAIDTIDPGSASKVLMYAEEHNSPDHVMSNFFLRRNIVFERLRLLARIFSEARCDMVLKILEQGGV